jgi:predicted phosphoadenosine phosphosulfate sulfurtransferase
VLTAARERLDTAFKTFDNIYLSVSGGKDSSVMMQLASRTAEQLGKKYSVLYIDFEAQYKATIDHMYQLVRENNKYIDRVFWVCLPISLRNAVSVIQPKWICWDKDEKDKWVRPMPQEDYIINIDNMPKDWDFFEKGQEFEDFILYFAKWFNETYGGITGAGIAIRSDESLNRFRTITSTVKEPLNDWPWTTRVRIRTEALNTYNFYPIFDWRAQDIWGAVAQLDLSFNEIYELMYKNGLTIHQQRLCQPYGDDQKNGLDQFRALEPETWEKLLRRVHGVNFGNIYARTSLLGNIKSEKPKSLTWQQYAVFLLESIGLYSPELRDHYYRKIRKFFIWWEKEKGIPISEIPDEANRTLESKKKVPSWRRVARAIERNDFWMKRLSFGQTKSDVRLMYELKKKYNDLLDPEATNDKHLKQLAVELNKVDEEK